MPLSKLAQKFPGKFPWTIKFPDSAGEAFQLPRAAVRQILFLFMAGHRATSSVIAVSRADRSLVVFREGIS